MILHKAANWH